jgi:hypothetical protein
LRIEPVEGLPDGHRVEKAIVQRNALGRAAEDSDPTHAPLELRAHLAHRLDREHVRAARDE